MTMSLSRRSFLKGLFATSAVVVAGVPTLTATARQTPFDQLAALFAEAAQMRATDVFLVAASPEYGQSNVYMRTYSEMKARPPLPQTDLAAMLNDLFERTRDLPQAFAEATTAYHNDTFCVVGLSNRNAELPADIQNVRLQFMPSPTGHKSLSARLIYRTSTDALRLS
jgi:hypothetical protein